MAKHTLNIQVRNGAHAGEKVMVLEGVLDAETTVAFRNAVRETQPATLVIDMTRVRYIDSSGLGVLIGTYVTFEKSCRRLLLAGLNDHIWDLFRTCKIEDVFTRYATVTEALETASV